MKENKFWMKPMPSLASTSKTLVRVEAVSSLNKWIIHWSFHYIVESKVLKLDGILIHMKKGRTQTRSCLKQPNWISILCNQLYNRILQKCQGKFLKRNVNLFFYRIIIWCSFCWVVKEVRIIITLSLESLILS